MFKTTALLYTKKHFQCMSKNFSNDVGFIGLGNMGYRMANNLIKKGQKLAVYDVNQSAMETYKDKGATICKNVQNVTENSKIVITMLPNNEIVLDSYLNDNGILKNASKDTLLIDCSTVHPNVSKKVFGAAKEKGIHFLDAPVSGGVIGAQDATLAFLVGGDKGAFSKIEDTLLKMGKCAIYCGDIGMGSVAKLCNNMLLAISMIGTAECMNLGISMGIDPKILMDVVNQSSGRCWSSEIYNPVPGLVKNAPASDNYKGGFQSKLTLKDLGIAQNLATDTKAPIALGSLAHQIFATMIQNGYADKDFSSVYEFIKAK